MTKITNDFYPTKNKMAIRELLSFFFLIMLPMLFMPLVSSAQNKVWDPGNNSTLWPVRASSTTLNVVTDGLSEVAGGSAFGQVALNNSTFPDGYTASQRVQFNGASAVTANKPTTRYFSFPVDGPVEVKVWWKTGGSGSRTLSVSDGTTVLGSLNSSDVTAGLILTSYYTGGAGTIYIYSSLQANYIHKIEVSTRTTWNGTSWTLGAPTSANDAVIDGTYSTTINGAITAKKLTVTSLGSLTINSGTNATIQNEVINSGTLTVENNANLIQVNSAVNTGNVVVKRNSNPLSRLDYTLWSSPVVNQNLAAFSPATSLDRFYDYSVATNQYSVIIAPSTIPFAAGSGYLIRMPNTASDFPSTQTFNGQFTGVPNNGDLPVAIVDGGATFRYNLVGNPYPSPISIWSFVNDNATNIESTLYFWRKTNGPLGQTSAYCTFVPGALVGDTGTFVTNSNTQSANPAGVIQTGQGFFVEAKASATSLIFKNSQRVVNTAGQFFKTKQAVQASKLWLNATSSSGDFSQMAVTYFADATVGLDRYDGKYINDSAFALTSNISNDEYTIQSRPAFDASDVLALNFKTDKAGDYTIAIDHSEGVFAAGQDIYLADSKTGAETNLKTSSYNFAAASGVDNTRFSLKYQKTLKVESAIFNENNVTVYKNNGTLYVNSREIDIESIQVYDVQGRLVAERKNVKATAAILDNLKANNQVLLVKISGVNNEEVTKKVVN